MNLFGKRNRVCVGGSPLENDMGSDTPVAGCGEGRGGGAENSALAEFDLKSHVVMCA